MKKNHNPARLHKQFLHSLTKTNLVKISQINQTEPHSEALRCIVDWVNTFLGNPHPDLGRKGPVCPFVPNSVANDMIWLADIDVQGLNFEEVCKIIEHYQKLFIQTPPLTIPESTNKAFIIIFSNLGHNGYNIVDEVQHKLKGHFVEQGLMLGEFHPNNQSPGLRNASFKPLRSPIPMIAIRHMMDSDLPFLNRQDYLPEERSHYIKAYLTHLRRNLSPLKFDEAINVLINAEVEKCFTKKLQDHTIAQYEKVQLCEAE